jgi:clan AA aspartic protease (TIGR02281 family)
MKKTLLLLLSLFTLAQISYAQSYYDKAMEAYKAEDYDKSLELFKQELEINPKNYGAYYFTAVIYDSQDKKAQALTNINQALKFVTPKEKIWLASCLKARGDIYESIENHENAITDYTTALKYDPKDETLFLRRAEVYFVTHNDTKAILDYNQVLKIDEGNVKAWAGLGRSYIAEKKYDEAEKILTKLIKLDPQYALGYYYRSLLYDELKKHDEAIDDMFNSFLLDETDTDMRGLLISFSLQNIPLALSKVNNEIKNKPNKEHWYYIRAQLYEEKDDYKKAIADYKTLLELTNVAYRASVITYIAKCYTEIGDYAMAISQFTEALALDSTRAYDYGYRGDAKRLAKDYKGAIVDFTKAIELEPKENWFYYRRGWIKEEFLKDTDGGLKDYNLAIAIDKDYSYPYLHRGRLYEFKLKDAGRAKKDYETILTLDTAILKNSNCRQYALFHLNRYNEAIVWQDSILRSYPTEGNYYDAACLYSLMQKPKEAISNLRNAFENGYRDFNHAEKDDDLDYIHNLTEFKSLVQEWKKKAQTDIDLELKTTLKRPELKQETVTIPMKPKGSGVYEVSCKINDLPLNFIFDTGASDISISNTEVQFMLKNGYLKAEDFGGKERYVDANGNIEVGTKITFRTVNFGGIILKNVAASVVHNKNAPLLFGQSALSKYGKIIIDNKKNILTLIVN